jgi:hypothetical protein
VLGDGSPDGARPPVVMAADSNPGVPNRRSELRLQASVYIASILDERVGTVSFRLPDPVQSARKGDRWYRLVGIDLSASTFPLGGFRLQ